MPKIKAEASYQVYLVGGAVRDQLMGHPVKDQDYVVVGATPGDLLSSGFIQVGADFPVFLHPETNDEYALARQERKVGVGYHGFEAVFSPDVTLEQDLLRRDLTINAMALSADGSVIDPYNGQKDLALKLLRHVRAESFIEDPVRVLRIARFLARYVDFEVAPETLQLCRDIVSSGELAFVPGERIWKEVSRGLMGERPSRMFYFLLECGALDVIAPELSKLSGVPQNAQHHPEVDTFVHVMLALDYSATNNYDLLTRYLVLVHDLGKGDTPAHDWPRHINHEGLGVRLVEALSNRWKTPKEFKVLGKLTSLYHLHCHRVLEHRSVTVVKLLISLDAIRQPSRLTRFVQACESDARGRLGFEHRNYPQAAYLKSCYEAISKLSLSEVVKSARRPENIPQLINNARCQAVAKVVKPSLDLSPT